MPAARDVDGRAAQQCSVVIIKNYGHLVGSSLIHGHQQIALTNVTLPYVRTLADLGLKAALAADPHLACGLNVYDGHITHEAVARDLSLEYRRYPVAA